MIILIACRENISFKKTAISTHGDIVSREEVKKPDTNYIQIIPIGLGVIKFIFSNDSTENNIKFYDSLFNMTFEINAEHVNHTKAASLAFAFNDSYSLLVFNVIDTQNHLYKIGDLNKNEKYAYLLIKDKRFEFQNWEDHVLDCFAVVFDEINNHIFSLPGAKGEIIVIPELVNGFTCHPVKIKGDYLEIEWRDDFDHYHKGWIKWRDGNNLIIELFYFA